jgi:AraC-like DNA-binding protein
MYQIALFLLIASYLFITQNIHIQVNEEDPTKLYFRPKEDMEFANNKNFVSNPKDKVIAQKDQFSFRNIENQKEMTTGIRTSLAVFEMKEIGNPAFVKLFKFITKLGMEDVRLLMHKFFQLEKLKIEEAALKFGFKHQVDFDRNFFKILSKTISNHKKFLKVINTIKEMGKDFFNLDMTASFFIKNEGILKYMLQYKGLMNTITKKKKESLKKAEIIENNKIDLSELDNEPNVLKKRMEMALFSYIRKYKNQPTNKETTKETTKNKYNFNE